MALPTSPLHSLWIRPLWAIAFIVDTMLRLLATYRSCLLPKSPPIQPQPPVTKPHPPTGTFYAFGRTRVLCTSGTFIITTADLRSSALREHVLKPGKSLLIRPFTVYFPPTHSPSPSANLTYKSPRSQPYSFTLHSSRPLNSGPPFHPERPLRPHLLQLAEVAIRAFLTYYLRSHKSHYARFGAALKAVLMISKALPLSGFEHALLLSMALQRLQLTFPHHTAAHHIHPGLYGTTKIGHIRLPVRATEIRPPGPQVSEHRDFYITSHGDTPPPLEIRPHVLLGYTGTIEVGAGLWIGDYTWVADGACFLKHEHLPRAGGQFARTSLFTVFYPTEVGPYALIGQNSRILPRALYIGKGAVVGHSAVVPRSIGDYAVAAGNPAKIIRFNVELAEQIESIDDGPCQEEAAMIDFHCIAQFLGRKSVLVLIGARTAKTLLQASRHFEKVFGICPSSYAIVDFLRECNALRIYNTTLITSIRTLPLQLDLLRRTFYLLWLPPSEEARVSLGAPSILPLYRGSCRGLLMPSSYSSPIEFSNSGFLRVQSELSCRAPQLQLWIKSG